jgi:hypothetical protein
MQSLKARLGVKPKSTVQQLSPSQVADNVVAIQEANHSGLAAGLGMFLSYILLGIISIYVLYWVIPAITNSAADLWSLIVTVSSYGISLISIWTLTWWGFVRIWKSHNFAVISNSHMTMPWSGLLVALLGVTIAGASSFVGVRYLDTVPIVGDYTLWGLELGYVAVMALLTLFFAYLATQSMLKIAVLERSRMVPVVQPNKHG